MRTPAPPRVRPSGVVADVRESAALTGGPDGARRGCWSPEWLRAREWLRGKLAEIPCQVEIDEAGNLWATVVGASPDVVVVGSHIDSGPHGGWLDGALGGIAALGALRQSAGPTPPAAVRPGD